MDKKKIFRIFQEIETELRPDKYFIKKKIPLWDIVRMSLYKEILIKFDLDKKDKKTIYIYSKDIIWRLSIFLKGLFFSLSKKSPIWIKKNTYIAWGHPRRKYENEKYIDIYIDPFLKLFGLKKNFQS